MDWGSEDGQSLPEYTIVLAAIAVATLFSLLVLGAALKGRFESSDDNLPPAHTPFTPPSQPGLVYPTEIGQCRHGGWRDFPQFRNEAECEEYVESLAPSSAGRRPDSWLALAASPPRSLRALRG